MTSSEDLNETTRNLLIALKNIKFEQPPPIIIKLVYDADTGIIEGITFDEVDKPWLEVSREQYDAGIPYKALKVVDGKLVPIPRVVINPLTLVSGDRWYTTAENMLIIGNERGWDERGKS